MKWRRNTTARTTAPSRATPQGAQSTSARFATRAGMSSSRRTSPSRRRRPGPSRPRLRLPRPPPDHDPAVPLRTLEGGRWDSGDPRRSSPRNRVPSLPGRHQALPFGHLSVPRAAPRVVRGTQGPPDDELVWRLASERIRRVLGLPEGRGRPARSARPRRRHVDPRRVGVLAGVRPRGNPPVSALPRPREGPAAGRRGPPAPLDPLDGPGGRDGREAGRTGEVVHQTSVPCEPLLPPRASEPPQRRPDASRPRLGSLRRAPRRRPRLRYGRTRGRGRFGSVRTRAHAEPDHASLLRET